MHRFWVIFLLVIGAVVPFMALTQGSAPSRSAAATAPAGPAENAAKPDAGAMAEMPAAREVATFAGGCFWCTEADFDKVPGVLATTSGYTGGHTANPRYEQVVSKTTGHAEAVQVLFDPTKVSYAQLLEIYWRSIDPTTVDRQFCDVGSPYRTAIFANSPAQMAAAQDSLQRLLQSKPFPEPIVTSIERAGPFYRAEEAHQDYHQKNPLRYRYYRNGCGRDQRLAQLWGTK